jgi:hypothetical protein
MRRTMLLVVAVVTVVLVQTASTLHAQSGALADPAVRRCFEFGLSAYAGPTDKKGFGGLAQDALANFDIPLLAEGIQTCRDARASHPADRLVLAADYIVAEAVFVMLFGLKGLPLTDEEGVAATARLLGSGSNVIELIAPLARIYLGKAHEHGFGVKKDIEIARRIYEEGVTAGDENAASALRTLTAKPAMTK